MYKDNEDNELTKSEKAFRRIAEKLVSIGIICFLICICFIFSENYALLIISKASLIVMGICFLLGFIFYAFSIINHISLWPFF